MLQARRLQQSAGDNPDAKSKQKHTVGCQQDRGSFLHLKLIIGLDEGQTADLSMIEITAAVSSKLVGVLCSGRDGPTSSCFRDYACNSMFDKQRERMVQKAKKNLRLACCRRPWCRLYMCL